jgi:hypothetical protein
VSRSSASPPNQASIDSGADNVAVILLFLKVSVGSIYPLIVTAAYGKSRLYSDRVVTRIIKELKESECNSVRSNSELIVKKN